MQTSDLTQYFFELFVLCCSCQKWYLIVIGFMTPLLGACWKNIRNILNYPGLHLPTENSNYLNSQSLLFEYIPSLSLSLSRSIDPSIEAFKIVKRSGPLDIRKEIDAQHQLYSDGSMLITLYLAVVTLNSFIKCFWIRLFKFYKILICLSPFYSRRSFRFMYSSHYYMYWYTLFQMHWVKKNHLYHHFISFR